jgi:acetyl esterase/lipase
MGLTAAVPAGTLRGIVLFCGIYDMRTLSGTGFPALRTFLWSYTGTRNWTSYPAIDQLSTVRHITAQYPPTFMSVGDADPFRFQATEPASALKRNSVPLTRCSGTAPGTAWATSTSSSSTSRKPAPPSSEPSASSQRPPRAEPMLHTTEQQNSAPVHREGRAARVA